MSDTVRFLSEIDAAMRRLLDAHGSLRHYTLDGGFLFTAYSPADRTGWALSYDVLYARCRVAIPSLLDSNIFLAAGRHVLTCPQTGDADRDAARVLLLLCLWY